MGEHVDINKKVLLIDDQEEITISVKNLLTGQDDLREINNKIGNLVGDFFDKPKKMEEEIYDVYTANDGETGYNLVKQALLENDPFSVVTIDMRMPGWDGLKTAKMIRTIDPFIEIVIITAYSDRGRDALISEIAKPEKMLYLKKPFEREEIMQVLLSLTVKWSLENKVKNQLLIIENANKDLSTIIKGISNVEDKVTISIEMVFGTIMKELSCFIDSDSGLFLLKNQYFNAQGNEIEKEILENEFCKDLNKTDDLYKIKKDKLFIKLRDDAYGYYDLNNGLKINEKMLRIFLSHGKNLLDNSFLYKSLEEKNIELEKKNKALIAANELNKKFLIISSHELRTPITLITAYTEMLERKEKFDMVKIVKGLKNASNRMNTLVERMLDVFVTSDNNGELIIIKKPHTVSDIERDLRKLVEQFLSFRNQKLLFINEIKDKKIDVDIEKLVEYVLYNLVINAIKFSQDGETISIRFSMADMNRVKIEVMDNGIGMTDDEISNMYKPLYVGGDEKYHHSGTYEYCTHGMGLGLTIVYNIIRLFNSYLECESKLGSGTKFSFTLAV